MSNDLCLLETLERLFGGEVRDCLWAMFGGQTVTIPNTPGRASLNVGSNVKALHAILGDERFAKLCEEVGGVLFLVPTPPEVGYRARRDIIFDLSIEGKTIPEIARTARCTERQVMNVRRSLRDQGVLAQSGKRRLAPTRTMLAPSIRQRLAEGEAHEAISKALNCSQGYVYELSRRERLAATEAAHA